MFDREVMRSLEERVMKESWQDVNDSLVVIQYVYLYDTFKQTKVLGLMTAQPDNMKIFFIMNDELMVGYLKAPPVKYDLHEDSDAFIKVNLAPHITFQNYPLYVKLVLSDTCIFSEAFDIYVDKSHGTFDGEFIVRYDGCIFTLSINGLIEKNLLHPQMRVESNGKPLYLVKIDKVNDVLIYSGVNSTGISKTNTLYKELQKLCNANQKSGGELNE